MEAFVVVGSLSLLAAICSLYALDNAQTWLGILPLIGYLAIIVRALQVRSRDVSQRDLCLVTGNSILIAFAAIVLAIEKHYVGGLPARIFATNALVLFCLLTGLYLLTDHLNLYARLTPPQRQWAYRGWLIGITGSLLMYLLLGLTHGVQGDFNVIRFLRRL